MSPVVDSQPSSRRNVEVIVVGAGFGGIAAAIELRRHGFEEVTILEKAPEPRRHLVLQQLPGRGLRRAEPPVLVLLRAAARLVAAVLAAGGDPRLSPRCRPRPRRRSAGAAEQHRQRLQLGQRALPLDGRDRARGRATRPTRSCSRPASCTSPRGPRSPGAETFAGHSFHSAAWDHDYDLAGKRVAVVGTGASAVQFVPEIAARSRGLTVFQRTGNWFMPRRNRPYPAALRTAIERVPGSAGLPAPVHVRVRRVADARDPPSADRRAHRRGLARRRSCARS